MEERARRRLKDLQQRGEKDVSLEELKQKIQERDEKDSDRKFAPLTQAADAIVVKTDGMTIEEVIGKITQLYSSG